MFSYFKSLISDEYDSDPGFIRLVRIVLAVAAIATVAISIIVIVTQKGTYMEINAAVTMTMAVMAGVSFFLSFHQILWPSKVVLPLVTLIGVALIAITGNGMHDGAMVGFTAIIIITSLLAGQKAIPLATVLTLLGVWLVAAADLTGINKSVTAKLTAVDTIAVVSFTQIIAGASLNALMGRLNTALNASRSNEKAQIQANQELRDLQTVLEERVAARTHNLELAAEIGRSVSQIQALDTMLREAVEVIRSRYDLYYAQVYLTNPGQTELMLKAGTGTVGLELVSRGHHLPVDNGSINGRAAIEKRPVVIENTDSSSTFKANSLLPDTRSEMAIPLLIGQNVVGVIDLQSRTAGALNLEQVPAFEALAGQFAIAIQNANLLAETEQARREVEKQARQLVRKNWNEYLDAIHTSERIGFTFEDDKVSPFTADASTAMLDDKALSIPIAVAGETLGSLVVELNDEQSNAQSQELLNTIGRQIAQQIESLRMLESANRYRKEAEEATHRMTREGWKSFMHAAGGKLGYMYNRDVVMPVNPDQQDGNHTISLPITVREEAIGKVELLDVDQKDGQSLELANAVADRLATHIESLRQYGQTQVALAQSEKLFEASRRLTEASDLQALVEAVIKSLDIPILNRAILGVMEYDPKGEFVSMTIAANWWSGNGSEATPLGTRYPIEIFKTVSLFASTVPVFFNDAFNDPRADQATLALVKQLNIRAVAVLPLFSGVRQVGVLMLEAEEAHDFSQEEVRLFSSLAPQIATILENHNQFERAQKQAEREATLNAIGQKIRSATSVEAVLQIAARELGHALGAPLTVAQLGLKNGQ
jgi:GAF domain-containing protein